MPPEKQKNAASSVEYETNIPGFYQLKILLFRSLINQLNSNKDPRARAQLDLLCKLIGKSAGSTGKSDFKLNLFNNEEEEL